MLLFYQKNIMRMGADENFSCFCYIDCFHDDDIVFIWLCIFFFFFFAALECPKTGWEIIGENK